ncbi:MULTISPECIES: molybdopterin-dependent oxidoreductase [Paracoccus]|jgi:hypothetical protein|uniref:Molybdopterin-dependent oxidoreductase n=1 Tax=Paracoccus litorisediminis TaxID=2006130 RepID=A0A844HNA3_9RHOB|nr:MULTISPECIES: molybdopterin-dependent oxidoreductase [Paracoccus]MBD9528343.1 molybdopterin-dependent oxidoreductase [Paracoccus sp. PAR01]MTH61803.1 molybdopterin-dependent oxidoreductase [Paracoccus litorisediminis]
MLIRSFAALIAGICFATVSVADTLPSPTGQVILTVTGNIANTNDGKAAKFDRAMLEGLGMTEITTSSPWYDKKSTFAGVPFKVVMDYVGAEGENVSAVALNDYSTNIPMVDVRETDVILATKLNGVDMDVRDKGPIFVIYPYDSASKLQTQTYYARSAWQVTKLIVE